MPKSGYRAAVSTMKKLIDIISDRIEALSAYLDDRDSSAIDISEQRHLDSETPERAYWHAGYRAALIDTLQLVHPSTEREHKTDIQSGSVSVAPDGRSYH